MNNFMIYLAGPITGCTFGEATNWRDYVRDKINPRIETLSPLRGKQYLEERSKGGYINSTYEDYPLSSAKGITMRDRNDVHRSDALLVNFLGATRVSIGTVMEIAWADSWNIPIVLVMEKEGNCHAHSMLEYPCGYIVDNLDMGINLVEMLLLPDAKKDNVKSFVMNYFNHLNGIEEVGKDV